MGLCSKLLLLTFLSISVIHGGTHCPSSHCGNSTLSIHYPFRLDNQISVTDCTYFNLTCNMTQSTTIVNLENSGDFYVQNIDYIERYIQLSDPDNCLTRRLMNFSLASSPFKAENVNNYTFYICPLDPQVLSYNVYPIGCLSNTTNITIATRQLPREFLEGTYGCRSIGTWPIPVTPDQLDFDGYYDEVFLFLTWDVVACKDCQGSGDQNSDESGAKSLTKIVAIASSLPVLIITAFSCFSVFCLHLLRMIREKYEGDSASAAAAASTTMPTPQTTMVTIMPLPSTTSNSGLDESKIMACTEIIVLSESGETIRSGNNNTCSICLENYCEKERIRIISKCGHCFHATCIQQWLGKNSTCPVCRTSLSDVVL